MPANSPLAFAAGLALLLPAIATAQVPLESSAEAANRGADRASRKIALLRLRIETWETSAADATRWLDAAKDSAGLANLRAAFLSGQRPARLVFSPTLAIEESAYPSVHSAIEWIYPVEYAGSELPEPAKPPPTSAEEAFVRSWRDSIIGKFFCPDTLEVRDVGQSLQARVQPAHLGPGSWDLTLNFDDVATPGNLHFGAKGSLIDMPLFNSFRTSVGPVLLKESRWRLLSVMEPPRGLDAKPSAQRWLTLVRIDPEA